MLLYTYNQSANYERDNLTYKKCTTLNKKVTGYQKTTEAICKGEQIVHSDKCN